jgi:hypothetical protein
MQFNNYFNFKRCSFTMLLGALAFISAPVTPIPCTNIFPKVFGADEANGGT